MGVKIICHGGVSSKSPRMQEKQKVVEHAARVGMFALTQGRTALDAVVEAITIMEDSPLCNAGTGSFIQMDGKVRMDAALMDQNLSVGAVIQISDVKNPIRVARTLMEKKVSSVLMGELATSFAFNNGHKFYDPRTEDRIQTWLSLWKQYRHMGDEALIYQMQEHIKEDEMLGTVGAVALDRNGNLAAGTSTGGLKLDMPGRVGDVPLIGCGTYCNRNVGVSCSGTGEKIIKMVLAKTIVDAVEYGKSFDEALDIGIQKMGEVKGQAGFISISSNGEIGYRFNTEMIATSQLEED